MLLLVRVSNKDRKALREFAIRLGLITRTTDDEIDGALSTVAAAMIARCCEAVRRLGAND